MTYRWEFAPSEDSERHADVVSAMASLSSYLGRTVDLVYARGEVHTAAPPCQRTDVTLAAPRNARWRMDDADAGIPSPFATAAFRAR